MTDFFNSLNAAKVLIQDLDLPNKKKIAHQPAAQRRRCLRDDEGTILMPVLEAELRDSNNISTDQ